MMILSCIYFTISVGVSRHQKQLPYGMGMSWWTSLRLTKMVVKIFEMSLCLPPHIGSEQYWSFANLDVFSYNFHMHITEISDDLLEEYSHVS